MVQFITVLAKDLEGIEIGRLQLDAPFLDLATGLWDKLTDGLIDIGLRIFTRRSS